MHIPIDSCGPGGYEVTVEAVEKQGRRTAVNNKVRSQRPPLARSGTTSRLSPVSLCQFAIESAVGNMHYSSREIEQEYSCLPLLDLSTVGTPDK